MGSGRVTIEDILSGRTDKCIPCLGTGVKSVYVGGMGGAVDCPECGGDGLAASSGNEPIAEFEVTEEQLESSHGYGRVVLTFGHGITTIDGTRFYEAGEYELRRVD